MIDSKKLDVTAFLKGTYYQNEILWYYCFIRYLRDNLNMVNHEEEPWIDFCNRFEEAAKRLLKDNPLREPVTSRSPLKKLYKNQTWDPSANAFPLLHETATNWFYSLRKGSIVESF